MAGLEVELRDFDDGHLPSGQAKGSTKLAMNLGKQSTNFVSIYDDLLPLQWAERIYAYAIDRGKPWGVYVLTKHLLEFAAGMPDLLAHIEGLWEADPERAFAMCATYALVMQRGQGLIGSDLSSIHGTAVWCLCSGVTNSVEYHIDYAELYRYETGEIHPPLYAGTCHISPFQASAMTGGDFCVNTGGIEHYRRFGYKAKLLGAEVLQADMDFSPDWHTVRYKYNRGILHDGDMPHLSTPVRRLPDGGRRVIMGFNCFTSRVGECCIRAPEHSQAFNRTVKLYQAVALATGTLDSGVGAATKYGAAPTAWGMAPPQPPAANRQAAARLSAKEVLKNPALAKLLVLAARKVKDEEAQKLAAAGVAAAPH